MREMPDEFVDVVYADPPFFSNKYYEVIWHDGAEIRSFEDRWKGGIHHYIEWMRERCFEIHKLLKPSGAFFLHCDWHASHYLKVMLDEVFGGSNFRNELVWHYTGRRMKSSRRFNQKHHTILFYAKSKKMKLRDYPTEPYTHDEYVKMKKQKVHVDNDGREWIWGHAGKGKSHNYRIYIDKAIAEGRAVDSVWDIPIINTSSKERLGYPTQKPEALLERIIKASSNEGDLVLDPFCGCGTTIAVAQRLNRQWIGIDVSPTACRLMKRRVEIAGAKEVEVAELPMSIEELKTLTPIEFQNWIVGAMGGTPSVRKVHDMGIDGYTFFDRVPVQVKQSERAGRPVVDDFETALRRHGESAVKAAKERKNTHFALQGIIVAFSFTKGAHEEAARAKGEGIDIQLLTVAKIVKEFEA